MNCPTDLLWRLHVQPDSEPGRVSLQTLLTRSWWRKSRLTLPLDAPGLSKLGKLYKFCEYGETLEDMSCVWPG